MQEQLARFLQRKKKLIPFVQEEIIGEWMFEPNSIFDGQKPIDISEEEFDKMIYYLCSGQPV